jgi:hypothetical protein
MFYILCSMLDKLYILEIFVLPILSNPASFFQKGSSFPKNEKRNDYGLKASVNLIYSYINMSIDYMYVHIKAQIEISSCCHSFC